MKPRNVRDFAIVMGAVFAVVIVGVGVVLQHRLAAITRTAATELMPTHYELHPPTFPFHNLDLGNLKVALPDEFDGAPHPVEGTNYVQVPSTRSDASVTFVPPQRANATTPNNYRALLLEFAAATGRPMPTLFDLQRTALETAPFDLWDLPLLGFKGTKTRRALLALKQLAIGQGSAAARIFETPDLGAIILTRQPDLTTIDVFDRRRGTMQVAYIMADPAFTEQVITAILASYELTTDDFSDEAPTVPEASPPPADVSR